ncbi:MAG: SpoIIE family protein phosphatase [Verrucomicrobiota bacterium]
MSESLNEKDPLIARNHALMEAAKGLISCTTIESIVGNILRHSLEMLQSQNCSLYLPDSKTHELIIYSARGSQDSNVHTVRIPWNKGVAGDVFHTKKACIIEDAQKDPRFMKTMDQKTGNITRSMICIPLLDNETCLGVLQAINSLHTDSFSILDQEIMEGLGGMVTSALVRLRKEELQKNAEKLRRDLNLANEIQKSFLPPEFSQFPRAEVHVRYQPAFTLSGDFYVVAPLHNDAVLFAVGDVSGKGIAAALISAQVVGEISALTSLSTDNLQDFVKTLNQNLTLRLSAGRFVATSFILYHPDRNEIEVICAGQFQPWRWDGSTWESCVVSSAPPLGIFPQYEYKATTLPCQSGERWMLFSDGINEGRNDTGDEYGMERLKGSLAVGTPAYVLEKAWLDWKNFVRIEKLHDDACLGILSCAPSPFLRVMSDTKQCKKVRNFIEGWCMYAGLNEIERGQVVLAFDEAFTNVLRHAYIGEIGNPIDISATLTETHLQFKMRDYGKTFDPDKIPNRPLEMIKPGGLGMHILHLTFQEVTHLPQNPGTELLLTKNLNPDPLPISLS